ncbi:izumo sperm-egg fusion protein 1 isoform X2 [Trichomycterus rosablanca]|uniref:izumo sperm-egg fusion protein 1 isoform X2 n=1 Tax=Trichomycterus rosablanca TaxID=2290929 RepID=UPI002F35086D
MNPGPFFLGWCFLMSFIPTARLCLQCDSVIRNMHEDFISSRTKITVQQQMDLKNIVDHAYVTYQDTSRELSGVIDPTTLYRAQTEYQSEFRRHWQKPNTDSIQSHMTKIVEKGKRILKKHLNIFVEEGLCPNKCGLLFQSVMDCSTCKYTLHTCQSETPPKDCGGQRLEAGETEQVVLDCYLPWHSLVVGKAKYYYFWKQGARNFTVEDRFDVLVVTQDSKIVLNQLSVSEQGVYRCFLLDRHGITLSHMHFILTVLISDRSDCTETLSSSPSLFSPY